MTEALVARPHVNVLDPEFYVDPWDAYAWLRDDAPVFWDPVQQLWVISRYEDVLLIEKHGARYSSFPGSRPHVNLRGDRSMINLDEPEHQAQRNLVSRRFTPGAIRSHEEHVRDLVSGILDAVTPHGECEAIEAVASRLPAMMMGELLGYPPEHWQKVRWWSEHVMHLAGQTSPDGPPHVSAPGLRAVIDDMVADTMELIEQRRVDPGDDLISTWVHTDGWDAARVFEEVILVLDGGAETTRTVIGTMIRDLALQPGQRQILLERPELLASTSVEEFIRWVSPILNMSRTVTEDHELHGQQLRAGDQVLLMYAAANRDPRVFDDPDRLDVTRSQVPNRHVAFGFASHFCLGASLARLEIRVMFEELLRRMPDWELADPDEPTIVPATFARAYDQIRIRFTPSPAA